MVIYNDKALIRKIIQIINGAWINNNLEILNDYFDDKMIIITQELKNKAAGREACIMNYKKFIETIILLDFNQGEPIIELWNNSAIAVYNYEITYKAKDKKIFKKGEDIIVFNREDIEDNYWKAVFQKVVVYNKHCY